MEKLILSILLLSGCANSPISQPVVVYKAAPLYCDAPIPQEIVPLKVNIKVISDKEDRNWIALDEASYANIATNNQFVIRYIKDLQGYADSLNTCINRTHKKED